MTGALDGIRVVDFGHYVAGPLAAVLLADNGADVIHIDRPGALSLSEADAYYNRGKRRLALDLKSTADRATARELISRSDVVIENFRPGVMERYGLDARPTRAENPHLIYCSLPGFPSDDARARLPAWEGVVEAATAGYRTIGEHWDPGRDLHSVDDVSRPLFTAIPVASNFAGVLGATCIVLALIVRERTGVGQEVTIPLTEAMAEAYSLFLAWQETTTEVQQQHVPGRILDQAVFMCSDGRYFDFFTHPGFLKEFIEAAGIAAAWREAGLLDMGQVEENEALRAELLRRFTALMLTEPASYWEKISLGLRSPSTMVRTPAEWLSLPHARESLSAVKLDDPGLGSTWMAGLAVHLSGTPGRARPRRLPGADADSIARTLLEPRRGPVPAASPDSTVRPLDGMSVIDLTQVVAGPTAGRFLADFGADVVKINNPRPSPTDNIVGHLHRGKRTMLLDVQSEAGQDVLWQLIDRADVVLQNFAMGSAERYGLGFEDVHRRKPEVVYVSMSAFAYTGSWGPRRGYENEGNAATGLSWRYGGEGGRPLYQPHLLNDAGTGLLGAFGAVLGLFSRYRTGKGQHVGTSLSQSSTLHQALYMFEYEGKRWNEPSGVNAYGWSPLHRLYRAKDGWFFLAAPEEAWDRLVDVVGLGPAGHYGDDAHHSVGPVADAFVRRFASQPLAHWIPALQAVDIGAHAVDRLDEAGRVLLERGVAYYEPDATGEMVLTPGVGKWLSATPPVAGANPRPVGSQVDAILSELGYSVADIVELAAAGVIRASSDLPIP